MAYDAGAAVGYLRLDATHWNNTIRTALVEVTKLRTALAAIANAQRRMIQRQGMDVAKDAAAMRVAEGNAMRLAQKGDIAASAIALRGRVQRENAIAIDGVRTQSKATLMETQHGYRVAEVEARRMATTHVSAFTRIRQAGVSAFNSIGTTMTRLRYGAQLIATTFVVAFGVIAWQLNKLLGGFAEFEQRMRKATSVTKYTEDEFRLMTREAETAAKKWGIPARDAADAFLFLGRAGLTTQQQLMAMPSVVAASKAMLEDLEETTEGTVNIMNAFNISFSETPHVVDMMTEAVNTSTMNLHEFLVSLSYAAKPAAAFNNSIQDISAMIGIAANAGIRGSKAGTALRYALTQLSAPTTGMKRLIRELHLQVYDTTGAMRPLVDILQDVADKTNNAGEQVRNYALKTLFGQRALSTMIALFDKGAVGIRAYSDQIKNAGNVTQTTAQKQMLAMKSQLERLRETWEALKRHIVQSFAPDVTRIIKVIISHIDDWTIAIDNNQKAVRSFVKEMVGMLAAFTKIVAGAAGFAVLMRVLGGIVMILQAILSPLGLILVAVFALQVGWEKNFLRMRDIGKTVFAELKEHAVDFFTTLINGFWKAVTYGINQMARLTQWANIHTIAQRMAKDVLTAFPANQLIEGMRGNLLQILTRGGLTPEEGMEALLKRNRDLYEKMRYIYSGRATIELSEKEAVDFFSKTLPAIREAMEAETEPAIKDILAVSTITTKTAIESLGNVFDAFRDKMQENINWLTEAAKMMLPPDLLDPLLAALRELQDVWGDIVSGKTIGEAGIPSAAEPGAPLSVSYAYPGLERGGIDFVRGYYGRLKVLYREFLDAYTDDWDAAIQKVTESYKTQIDVMADMFQAIRNDWATALEDLMRQGSSFIDFMDSFFQAILSGFRRMVAEMVSIQMFEAMFGKDVSGREIPEAGAGLWGAIGRGLRYLFTGKYEVPTIKIPGESLGQPQGLNIEDYMTDWGGGAKKITPIEISNLGERGYASGAMIPDIALNITNNSVPITLKQVGKPAYSGRQIVVNYVMEEAVTNPRFREILAGGA